MSESFVVTGGGQGVGRAIVERLVGDGNSVVVLELNGSALDWLDTHAARARLAGVEGNAADVVVANKAADRAEAFGILRGWVNNAAIFRDARLDTDQPDTVAYLLSDAASFVTGAVLPVDGGRAARGPDPEED